MTRSVPPATDDVTLAVARQVADAVLYEGYVLFPYRASAAKNRYRWQWGVVIPPDDVDRLGEPAGLGCDLLVHGTGRVRVLARFLRLRHRQVHDPHGRPVDRVEVDGAPVVTWDEGVEVELPSGLVPVPDVADAPHTVARRLPGDTSWEELAGGVTVERSLQSLDVELDVSGDRVAPDVTRLHLRVHNRTPGPGAADDRLTVLRRGMVGVHLLVAAEDGACFASLVDPPAWAEAWTGECARDGLHPVVVGPPGDEATVMLASPIILPDHPEVAPESPGPSFDATEVDELLALAVMGLTEEEKREARATDARAAELVDRTDTLPGEVLRRLHGRLEDAGLTDHRPVDDDSALAPPLDVDEEIAELLGVGEAPTRCIRLGDQDVPLGSQVRLHPRRRADAHDLFVEGRVATVERIVTTVEGETMLGVTLVDDPAAELHRWYGRFQYFDVHEVTPLSKEEGP